MMVTLGTMATCRNAKVMPTASASMLVAMASMSSSLRSSLASCRFPALLVFLMERIPQHLAAHERQQRERDPMVDGRDKIGELACPEPSR